MKSVLALGILFFSTHVFALGFDGCYHMFQTNNSLPVICLQGTAEEGIGGANARISLFKTNLDVPMTCVKSSSLKSSQGGKGLIVDVNGRREFEIVFTKTEKGLRMAEIQFTKNKFFAAELSEKDTERFLQNLEASNLCK